MQADLVRELKSREIEEAEESEAKLKLEAEKAEFNKWKDLITVEAEGQLDDNQQSISDFIQFIERRKVVMIEDLATEFQMTSKDAITRI